MGERLCLNCEHWRPVPHDGWSRDRYSSHYDARHLRVHLSESDALEQVTVEGWPGRCLLHPASTSAMSIHVCGQWSVNMAMVDGWRQYLAIPWAVQEAKRLSKALKELRAVHARLVDRTRKQREGSKKRPGARLEEKIAASGAMSGD